MADIAKVFWSGRSQAVRLPKAFRVDTDTVNIRREGNAIILEPIEDEWGWLENLVGKIDDRTLDQMLAAIEEEVPQQERPELDELL